MISLNSRPREKGQCRREQEADLHLTSANRRLYDLFFSAFIPYLRFVVPFRGTSEKKGFNLICRHGIQETQRVPISLTLTEHFHLICTYLYVSFEENAWDRRGRRFVPRRILQLHGQVDMPLG